MNPSESECVQKALVFPEQSFLRFQGSDKSSVNYSNKNTIININLDYKCTFIQFICANSNAILNLLSNLLLPVLVI